MNFRSIAMARYAEEDGLSAWGRLGWLIGCGASKLLGRQMSR